MPRDDDVNYLSNLRKLSLTSNRMDESLSQGRMREYPKDGRKLQTIDRGGNINKTVRRSDKDTLTERREMEKRTRSRPKKRSNRLELRRKRSALRNRNEINHKDRRENRRAGQQNNRHITVSPTKSSKRGENSSKSPGTRETDNEKKTKKQNTFTRPPSAFGAAPPGSSASYAFSSNLSVILFSSIPVFFTFS